jgi:hypothetical protein
MSRAVNFGHCNNLGILWFAGGEQARAESAFETRSGFDRTYADAHGNLANLLAGAGKFGEARDHLK